MWLEFVQPAYILFERCYVAVKPLCGNYGDTFCGDEHLLVLTGFVKQKHPLFLRMFQQILSPEYNASGAKPNEVERSRTK